MDKETKSDSSDVVLEGRLERSNLPVEDLPTVHDKSPVRAQAAPRFVSYREKAGQALSRDLPTTTPEGSDPRKVLKTVTPTLISLHHEAINRFRHYTELAESQGVLNVAAYCTSQMARHVLKELELGVGRSLNINAKISSQAQVPDYDSLPEADRAKYEADRAVIETKAEKVE